MRIKPGSVVELATVLCIVEPIPIEVKLGNRLIYCSPKPRTMAPVFLYCLCGQFEITDVA